MEKQKKEGIIAKKIRWKCGYPLLSSFMLAKPLLRVQKHWNNFLCKKGSYQEEKLISLSKKKNKKKKNKNIRYELDILLVEKEEKRRKNIKGKKVWETLLVRGESLIYRISCIMARVWYSVESCV